MEIQQAIIIVMLTAVICIFIGMITQSLYPDGKELGGNSVPKFARILIFGFVIIPWVLIVTVCDLYIENKDYEKAMGLLDQMEAQGISRSEVVQRKSKVVMLNNINALADNYTAAESKSVSINNPIEDYKKQILKQ